MTKITEICECGGQANFIKWDGVIPILKCEKCGDTFDAHEDYWRDEE